MNKDELIIKQQLEIEGLKQRIESYYESVKSAHRRLVYVQQWSTKDDKFSHVSMMAAIEAARDLDDVLDGERK